MIVSGEVKVSTLPGAQLEVSVGVGVYRREEGPDLCLSQSNDTNWRRWHCNSYNNNMLDTGLEKIIMTLT